MKFFNAMKFDPTASAFSLTLPKFLMPSGLRSLATALLAMLSLIPQLKAATPQKIAGLNGTYDSISFFQDDLDLHAYAIRVGRTLKSGALETIYRNSAAVRADMATTGIKELPMVNNYNLAWSSPQWEE